MSANTRPWDIRLWLYPGANPASLSTLWGLPVDISSRLKRPGSMGGQPINYRGGRRSVSAFPVGAVDFSEMDLSLDNKDGHLCVDKVDGPYWPLLDLNTPIKMGVVTGYDDFDRTAAGSLGTSSSGQTYVEGVSFTRDGTSAAVSMAAANTVTRATMNDSAATDYDVVATVWATQTSTGAVIVAGVMQGASLSNYTVHGMDFKTDGTVAAKIHKHNGAGIVNIASADPLPMTYTPNERFRVRGMRDGSLVAVKIWKEADPEPAEWTASATETDTVPASIGLFAWRLSSNTNTGRQLGFDDLKIVGVEFPGTVVEWPTEWDMTGRNGWAAIKCAGILRRLRQAKTATLQSPLRRQLPFYTPTGYWPLEDGPRSTVFASAVGGRQPAKFTKMTLAADDSLPGTLVAPTFNAADGSITAFNQTTLNGNGFAVSFLAKIGTNPGVKTRLFSVTTNRGNAARVDCSLNYNGVNGIRYVDVFDSEGNLLASASNTVTSVTDWTTDWYGFCLIVELNGGNTLGTFLNFRVGDTLAYYSQASWATGLTPWAKVITIGGTNWNGTSIAHLFCGLETLPFVSYPFFNASSGFDGELASDRIARIGQQAGIPVQIEPGNSEALGPQPRLRPVEIMQASADTDFGILYERSNGLGFRPRSARWNQPVLLSLSKAAGHLAEPPKPVRDDQRIRNKITVTRDGGASATSVDEDSISRVGEYEDPATVYTKTDGPLQDMADLRRFLGTRKGMRWSGVKLDFARNPSLLPTWRSRTHSFRFTITTGLTQVTGAEPDLLAEGWSASLDPLSWTVDIEPTRADVWDVGNYDDAVANRSKYGPTGATLDADIDDNDLTILVDAAGETWKTGAVTATIAVGADQGRGGEHIPITNVSGPVSGVYTLTASARAANGVSRSWDAGASVTLANQVRYGF